MAEIITWLRLYSFNCMITNPFFVAYSIYLEVGVGHPDQIFEGGQPNEIGILRS